MLHPPTKEQKEILRALESSNVSVDAVAGSGKTTTILHIAQTFKDKSICCITYNAKLKNETKEKINSMGIHNLSVFTYHGSCNCFYLNTNDLVDDLKLKSSIDLSIEPKIPINYDIIIIDEVQDMNIVYAKYILKLISDNLNTDTRLVILGDKNQCINQYNDARHRFLTLGSEIFINNLPWVHLKLTETFRVPYEICEFLNKVMLQEDRMISNKVSGHKPRYLITNTFSMETNCRFLMKEVKYYLNLKDEVGNQLYKPDDIFILSVSVKKKVDNHSPTNILANQLSDEGILVHVTNEEGTPDEKLLKNKIVFSTYNSVKGLERKVVIALNFDSGYFEYFDKDANPMICPNKLYVGVTRSLERLSLIHHFESGFLPFLKGVTDEEKERNIELYCDINPTDGGGNTFRMRKTKEVNLKPVVHGVTDTVKHLKMDVLEYANELYIPNIVREEGGMIMIDTIIEQSSLHCENVSDITGTAIPMYYAMKVFKHDINQTNIKLNGENDHINILRIANQTNCMISNAWYKLNQVKRYNWLSPHQLMACKDRVQSLCDVGIIHQGGRFEESIECTSTINETYRFTLIGQVDYIDEKNVVEFKCVKKIEIEHMIQLLLYKYINETNGIILDNYYLYNVLDDQLFSLECSYTNLEKMVTRLVKAKYIDNDTIDNDEEFRELMRAEGIIPLR